MIVIFIIELLITDSALNHFWVETKIASFSKFLPASGFRVLNFWLLYFWYWGTFLINIFRSQHISALGHNNNNKEADEKSRTEK